jgi:hypothetical protein
MNNHERSSMFSICLAQLKMFMHVKNETIKLVKTDMDNRNKEKKRKKKRRRHTLRWRKNYTFVL